jgi:hypothetical protein
MEQMRERPIEEADRPPYSSLRHPVTQEQIDDILANELKEFEFPVKPTYNSRLKVNGKTIGEFYAWGQLKRIKKILIGKQDSGSREFLVETLLHEYYEAYFMERKYDDEFFAKLFRVGDEAIHKWIDKKVKEFFDKKG